MFTPRELALERGWPGRIEGDRVIQLAAQTLQSFFTGGGSAREHAEWALADVDLRPPVLRPPTVRDFMAFEEHVATARRQRGSEVPPEWYAVPVFYFSNPTAIFGPDVAFDGHRPPSVLAADGADACAVELYSLTKSFSMAGWRVGFVLGRADVVAALTKLKSYLDYGTFQPIQIAATVTLREAHDYPAEVCEIYRLRRDALCRGLARAGWPVEPPLGTMFVWAEIPDRFRNLGSLEFALLLAREANVAVSPGIGFGDGGDRHVRFALVENEQRIGQATRAIRKLLER